MESIIRQEFYSMITSNAEAIDRLKQLLDNIDDEIENACTRARFLHRVTDD